MQRRCLPIIAALRRLAARPILIEVIAPWFPTRRARRPQVDAVPADPPIRQAMLPSVDPTRILKNVD